MDGVLGVPGVPGEGMPPEEEEKGEGVERGEEEEGKSPVDEEAREDDPGRCPPKWRQVCSSSPTSSIFSLWLELSKEAGGIVPFGTTMKRPWWSGK